MITITHKTNNGNKKTEYIKRKTMETKRRNILKEKQWKQKDGIY
jgi:hypothetical protein